MVWSVKFAFVSFRHEHGERDSACKVNWCQSDGKAGELKDAAEEELVVQLDKKTMVRLLSIGEIFRAEKLFEAALKMTKVNISWLRSQV